MSSAALKAAATGAATPEQARSPYEALKRRLESNRTEFKPLLGSDANVDKFLRVVLNAILANPDLIEADFRTLVASCMKAAQDGLMPDGREAVLNVYNTKVKKADSTGRESWDWISAVQYLPMVGGMVKKLYDSGDVTYVDAAAVYANDKFTFRRGDSPSLEHEPTMEDEPGTVVAAYAVIKLKSGEIKREVMPRRDIEAVRAASKSGENEKGPWKKWYDQQAIKSVLKRAYKQLPKSDALERVIAADNEALGFASASPLDLVKGAAPALTHAPTAAGFEITPTPAGAAADAVPVGAEPTEADFQAQLRREAEGAGTT